MEKTAHARVEVTEETGQRKKRKLRFGTFVQTNLRLKMWAAFVPLPENSRRRAVRQWQNP